VAAHGFFTFYIASSGLLKVGFSKRGDSLRAKSGKKNPVGGAEAGFMRQSSPQR
jgi:hypothetical protein